MGIYPLLIEANIVGVVRAQFAVQSNVRSYWEELFEAYHSWSPLMYV